MNWKLFLIVVVFIFSCKKKSAIPNDEAVVEATQVKTDTLKISNSQKSCAIDTTNSDFNIYKAFTKVKDSTSAIKRLILFNGNIQLNDFVFEYVNDYIFIYNNARVANRIQFKIIDQSPNSFLITDSIFKSYEKVYDPSYSSTPSSVQTQTLNKIYPKQLHYQDTLNNNRIWRKDTLLLSTYYTCNYRDCLVSYSDAGKICITQSPYQSNSIFYIGFKTNNKYGWIKLKWTEKSINFYQFAIQK